MAEQKQTTNQKNYFNMMTQEKTYEEAYRSLLLECLDKGVYRNDRTGVGSNSIFNVSLKLDVSKYFPLITGRKMFQKHLILSSNGLLTAKLIYKDLETLM